MPRIPRNNYPVGYYHIMNRGVAREAIFHTNSDKRFYRNLVKKVFRDYQIQVLAYCIMGNHFHFVIKGDLMIFAKALHRTNLSYAMAYNSRKDRVGHVFQNRFKSEIIKSREHLLAAVRYVHNNPVKAGMIRDPKQYVWSSCKEYLEKNVYDTACITTKEQRDEILEYFENSPCFFEKFHREKDYYLFIDTLEDSKGRKEEVAMNIIESSYPEINRENIEEASQDIYLIYSLVALLLERTTLTHQEIGDILNVSKSQVGKIARRKGLKTTEGRYIH